MSGYNAKNYTEQGGNVTHIGGKLIIEEGASVEGLPSGGGYTLPAASNEALGGVFAVDDLEDCAATDVAGINSFINTYLLARLRSAGILLQAESE